ncbi:DUF3131 domain-containing protein (plasmid) [Paracoccus liaowanqingii]|uniref:DUF3131 domain-containing protein n=2 Tax=Paracoccus liaowanqingii TaxID=2560053 RepID=A0A4Y5SSI8_9RHOB|nr:DUF3131 domain-containing protein [Paracoccus liaowanqingii]
MAMTKHSSLDQRFKMICGTKPALILLVALLQPLFMVGAGTSAAADEHWPDRPLATTDPVALPRFGPLTDDELEMARIAWRYFENNHQPQSGLVNSTHNYPSVTLWDTASYLAGLIAAHSFGLVEDAEAEERLRSVLSTLEHIQLFRNECPNKAYNTQTVQLVNYVNQPAEIGCSAIDMGRMLIWLRIVQQRYPQFEEVPNRIVRRWNFCGLVQEPGVTYGTALAEDGSVRYLQEGRLGYEEYAAKGFSLWGFDVSTALEPEPYETIWLYGVEVAYDSRDPRILGAHNYVVSESYALGGVEFGWDYFDGGQIEDWLPRFAQNIYTVQERRFEATGIVTARTEHQLSEAPYFVYDTIFSNGRPWATMTEGGEFMPQLSAVALKGALGLWALWDTPYTDMIFDLIKPQFDPELGFYEGIFEEGGEPIRTQTSNNNGIMLETLLFKTEGPLLKDLTRVPTAWTQGVDDSMAKANCLPVPQVR